MSDPTAMTPREILLDLYHAAVAAAAPGPALVSALRRHPTPSPAPWVLALGKAALPMARAAVEHLAALGLAPAGGIVVAPEPAEPPHAGLPVYVGDHPEPLEGSLAAAAALGDIIERIPQDAEVWVLLSGGTTSLIGSPLPAIPPADFRRLYQLLLASGLDIAAMNAVRKRFSRWGGGKLARALTGRTVRVFVVSDVIGDDLAAIASGPCVPDPATRADVVRLLTTANLLDRLPSSLRAALDGALPGAESETPKAGAAAFARVTNELIASNRLALDAAAKRAAELGLATRVFDTPLAGEAKEVGASVAETLVRYAERWGAQAGVAQGVDEADVTRPVDVEARGIVLLWGGETTVTLGEGPVGLGGRCQELALAAAKVLAGVGAGVALLAAGTDGRDGPTDAAGGIVDASTWREIANALAAPETRLAEHDAFRGLEAAAALVRMGMTGTNVMDVVVGVALHGPGAT